MQTYAITINGTTIEMKAKSRASAACKAIAKIYGSVLPRGETRALVTDESGSSIFDLSNP